MSDRSLPVRTAPLWRWSSLNFSSVLVPAATGAALALGSIAFMRQAGPIAVMVLRGHGFVSLIQTNALQQWRTVELIVASLAFAAGPVFLRLRGDGGPLEVRLRAALEESEAAGRLSILAQDIAGVGHWSLDRSTAVSRWSQQSFAIFGLTANDFATRPNNLLDFYHPDDEPLVRSTIENAYDTGAPFDMKVRIHRPHDGEERTIMFKGEAERGEGGRVTGLFGVVRDITAEELARTQIEESEARFRLLAESAMDLVMKVDVEDVIKYVSPSAARYGYAPEDMVGNTGASFIHPDDRARVASLATALKDDQTIDPGLSRSYRLRTADGGYVWMEGALTAISDAKGRPRGVISYLRDISEQLEAVTALADSEARYRQLAESTTDVVLTVDQDHVIQYVSPSIQRYGYQPDDLIGVSEFSMVHPDDIETLREIIGELFATGGVDPARERAYRIRTADGGYVWMEGNPAIIRDEDGASVRVITQMRDVTERRLSSAALAESELRYRVIAENATDVVSRMGLDGRINYVSPSVKDITGHALETVMGANIISYLHPEDVEPTFKAYDALIASGRVEAPLAYRFWHKEGRWVWLEGAPTLLRGPTGAPVEIIDCRRDVTARLRLETDLRAARDVAEDAAAVKAAFMANMSHEIRTPLTAILGFTALLEERRDLHEQARSYVGRVAGGGKALLSIVNDILDFSKLEAGQVEICPRPVTPSEILRDALLIFTPQAEAKGLSLKAEISPDLPSCLVLDPDRVRQILLNLIGNAIKFTEEGSVQLVASYDVASQQLEIQIHDTGAGMDPSQQERLFQRFSQVDASTTRSGGGTGLGLAICKGLAESMNGGISVSSSPGRGSVFCLRIFAPIGAVQRRGPFDADGAAIDGLRVLVADDNPVNRELVRMVLETFGADVTEASDGREAIETAKAAPFDVILMDIRMPEIDGPTAARRIRSETGPNQTIPILAFPADSDLAQYEQEVSDFDGAVRKPIVPRDLVGALVRSQDRADFRVAIKDTKSLRL